MEAFQFSKFHENVGELEKGNIKRGLNMTFKVKDSQNYWEKWLRTLQAFPFFSRGRGGGGN